MMLGHLQLQKMLTSFLLVGTKADQKLNYCVVKELAEYPTLPYSILLCSGK
jgi:hypothetical protein